MAVTKIEHVGVMVTDLEASIAFYRDVVGLEVISSMELDNGTKLYFLGFPNAKETVVELVARKVSSFPEEGRVHHICFTVDNIEEEVERLKEINAAFVDENINTLPNGAKNIFIYGPDRERIEFLETGK
ncbi:VOC family protein [Evansella sp. AB-P1]|uniref:VOC family protein n=1 Tax=Evansella sp. AB-P1 TaxID=3037653 RepID=UPI00241C92B3|nr:VOC family protein [Evansella sp. AB-P1]MDG5790017.1 VOC family protein [Evansella sp. AB-P1]